MKNKVRLTVLILAIIVLSFTVSVDYAFAEEHWAYLGGIPIGIGLAENGLIVTGFVDVITDEGAVCPARGSEILTNDVIIEVNHTPLADVREFASLVQSAENSITLTVKRGERVFHVSIIPVTDTLTGLKKLGLTVKNGINGIGTLTYVLPNGKYGALGHGIVDNDTGKTFLTDQGHIYRCKITSFHKPNAGKAGELVGTFVKRFEPLGTIDLCDRFGVYGLGNESIFNGLTKVKIGSSSQLKLGNAYIYTTINGDTPMRYEIQIVKTRVQNERSEKSMLIKITDPALLEQTEGILQGMSGSPIVQNDRIVGAVTHVLLNDSTLGYGLYIDWMLQNSA